MKKCKLCSSPTETTFTIENQEVVICDNCAHAIFIQQAWSLWLNRNKNPKYTFDPELHAPPMTATIKHIF